MSTDDKLLKLCEEQVLKKLGWDKYKELCNTDEITVDRLKWEVYNQVQSELSDTYMMVGFVRNAVDKVWNK